jgi:DNA-binding response OmpR family regulator
MGRVLLADADDKALRLYQDHLSREGFTVQIAANGQACLSALRCNPPDVLVLDPGLPWEGGDSVLAAMAADAQLAHIPVVILSPWFDYHPLGQGQNLVRSQHMKPLAPSRLATILHTLLHHEKFRRDNAGLGLLTSGQPLHTIST